MVPLFWRPVVMGLVGVLLLLFGRTGSCETIEEMVDLGGEVFVSASPEGMLGRVTIATPKARKNFGKILSLAASIEGDWQISIIGAELSAEAAQSLPALPAGATYALEACRLSPEFLSQLGARSNPGALTITRATLQQAHFAELASFGQLQSLRLQTIALAEHDLAPLAQAAHLQELTILHSPVTDASLADIAKAPKLASFSLFAGDTTKGGRDRLAALLRERKGAFSFHQGGFLGVTGSQAGPLEIRFVIADGPAAQAGLRAGDLILEVAGQQTANWEQLTRVIGQLPVGEEIQINIERNGKRLTKMARLAPRE